MKGKWNYTEPIDYRVIVVRLLPVPGTPLHWQNVFAGEHRQVVEITHSDGCVFMIDNADGSGLLKIKNGGGPDSMSRHVEGCEFIGLVPDDQAQQFNEIKCRAIDMQVDTWQQERYPEEWKRLESLRKAAQGMLDAGNRLKEPVAAKDLRQSVNRFNADKASRDANRMIPPDWAGERITIVMAIFGKHRTNEKVLIPCPKDRIPDVMRALNNELGPDWVYIDALKPGEGIRFTDGLPYRGFVGGAAEHRYSDAIIKVL
jgi:hypothetical protein